MRYRTVLLDRDGVINRMRSEYVLHWEELELLPGSLDAIARLTRSGREVIVLTNQSAIAQRLVTAKAVHEIHQRLAALAAEHGGQIRAFLICPHDRDEGCGCRKPAPGLLFRARDELGVDLSKAVMVGDQTWDIEAAEAAGCDALLVNTESAVVARAELMGCKLVASLTEAAELICAA
jgi:histidinol-phosphate phosphatase family protein